MEIQDDTGYRMLDVTGIRGSGIWNGGIMETGDWRPVTGRPGILYGGISAVIGVAGGLNKKTRFIRC